MSCVVSFKRNFVRWPVSHNNRFSADPMLQHVLMAMQQQKGSFAIWEMAAESGICVIILISQANI